MREDDRVRALRAWLTTALPDPGAGAGTALSSASADASFRRYFRVARGAETWIAMDAPPPREDCRPFVSVAALLREAGLNAPQVLAQDLEQGFLLLTDLGTQTYLAALTVGDADAATADRLFRDALEALIVWQRSTREGVLPVYDAALLERELALFPEWYIARHLGITLTAAERDALAQVEARLVAAALAQPRVFVHRDYMPRNLMVCAPNPGVLDFQDAVLGPITYDVVSLFRDAFLSWEEARVLDWTARYWERARTRGLPVHADFGAFYRDFEWMGLQRHLKVLGIFARLNYRDGKPDYLADTPRFIAYARAVAQRYNDLAPLARLLDRLEARVPTTGYTF
ncbi:MAG: aminoglycoside phosphotransferase family protein [Burkholderiales bacterium]